jgi:hypothetical protein
MSVERGDSGGQRPRRSGGERRRAPHLSVAQQLFERAQVLRQAAGGQGHHPSI